MARRGRRRALAVIFVLGATLLTGGNPSRSMASGKPSPQKRFLAVAESFNQVELLTIVTTSQTQVTGQPVLAAGTRVRLSGIRQGRTVTAGRIEVIAPVPPPSPD